MLARLLYENRTKQLDSLPDGGFIDLRRGKRQLLCGIYNFLHKKCIGFPKLNKKQFKANGNNKFKKKIGKKSSSKRIGNYFHRQVHHALICGHGKCQCPEKKTKAVLRKSSSSFDMVRSAEKFIMDEKLVALAGEQVISAVSIGLGTRFDMLCERLTGSKNLVLVSWKTGSCPFDSGVSRVGLLQYIYKVVDPASSSVDFIIAREHLCQLALELYMLCENHQVDIQEACICYLMPSTRAYRSIFLKNWKNEYKEIYNWILKLKR
jgi:hypothetical protein